MGVFGAFTLSACTCMAAARRTWKNGKKNAAKWYPVPCQVSATVSRYCGIPLYPDILQEMAFCGDFRPRSALTC